MALAGVRFGGRGSLGCDTYGRLYLGGGIWYDFGVMANICWAEEGMRRSGMADWFGVVSALVGLGRESSHLVGSVGGNWFLGARVDLSLTKLVSALREQDRSRHWVVRKSFGMSYNEKQRGERAMRIGSAHLAVLGRLGSHLVGCGEGVLVRAESGSSALLRFCAGRRILGSAACGYGGLSGLAAG
jgi:hypothetical protein